MKKPPWKQRNGFQKWGKKYIQIASYNGAHMVYSLYPKGTPKYILKIKSTLVAELQCSCLGDILFSFYRWKCMILGKSQISLGEKIHVGGTVLRE